MHLRAMKTRKRVPGSNHPDTITSVYDLRVDLLLQLRFENAEMILRQALKEGEKGLGPGHR